MEEVPLVVWDLGDSGLDSVDPVALVRKTWWGWQKEQREGR